MTQAKAEATRTCPYCGEEILATARKCRFCREYLEPELRRQEKLGEHDAVDRMLMPVGRPASAIAAGYLGLFALLPFFGIVAVIVGLVALGTLRRNPEMHGRGRAWFGIVMGALTTLLYGSVIVLATLQSAGRH